MDESSKPAQKELGIRIISGLVLSAIALLGIYSGGLIFCLMLGVVIALLSHEWALMVTQKSATKLTMAIGLCTLSALAASYWDATPVAFLVLIIGSIAAGLYAYSLQAPATDVAYGCFYIGIPALILMWLRRTPMGIDYVYLVFVIVWASDSAAYIVGRLVGGPKLWVKYSPNKTWSGFAGGLLAGIFVCGTLCDFTHVFKHSTSSFTVGLSVALATMAGDLWESMLKRRYGVKDSGRLIPGHGGLLDRVDGLMFAIIVMGLIRWLVILGTVI